MGTWTADELDRVGRAEELQVSSVRTDGSLRPYVTIWVVRVGDDVYVRSAYGPENGWFRRALSSGRGRVRAGGVEKDVTFEQVGSEAGGEIDAAYHAKYDRYGPAIVGSVTGSGADLTTIRLTPRA
ncbi:DUF2255 family protein [Cellulosimicrobium sp. CUA-896]|uniref:DUF2255 family protein n=1 Tax=Cellulosimicrobium sp. CUA-896 TaxID=1517881 RepID=UPI00095A3042|nr:DUF2255 family protein [Cellulosimicrobium sp. CUA-896]OLT52271.1 hypothetical protein BJF88_13925 [Cellulosimicrobium sp. CUA-896]